MVCFTYECRLDDPGKWCVLNGSMSTDLDVDGSAWDFVRCQLFVVGLWTCMVWVDGDAPETRTIEVRRAPHGGIVREDVEVPA